MSPLPPPRLGAITPGDHLEGRDLVPWLFALGEAGVRAVVIREPHLDVNALDVLVLNAWATIRHVIVHDRHPRARHFGMPLHLPSHGDPGAFPGLWSQSCHTPETVTSALDRGAWWTTLSPVWKPTSKPTDTRPTLGLERFTKAAQDRPVLALGGVNPQRLRDLRAAGAWGAAVSGVLFDQPSPTHAAKSAEALLDAAHGGPTR